MDALVGQFSQVFIIIHYFFSLEILDLQWYGDFNHDLELKCVRL